MKRMNKRYHIEYLNLKEKIMKEVIRIAEFKKALEMSIEHNEKYPNYYGSITRLKMGKKSVTSLKTDNQDFLSLCHEFLSKNDESVDYVCHTPIGVGVSAENKEEYDASANYFVNINNDDYIMFNSYSIANVRSLIEKEELTRTMNEIDKRTNKTKFL